MDTTGAISCKTVQTESETNNSVIKESATQDKIQQTEHLSSVASPIVYVYKTKADYSHNVPVLMDQSKSRIISYPHPNDLLIGGKLCLPTP